RDVVVDRRLGQPQLLGQVSHARGVVPLAVEQLHRRAHDRLLVITGTPAPPPYRRFPRPGRHHPRSISRPPVAAINAARPDGDARRAVRMSPGEADSALLAGPSPLTGSWAVIEAGGHGHWVRGREHTLPGAMSGAIVVGTDGSPEAERAVEWAAGEAVLRGRSLRSVHAVERWPFRVPLLAPSDGAVEEGKAILEAARAAVRERWPDLGVTTALVEEETEKALREESKDAFALVLGRRGRGGFAGMPLGSTSRRMASESSVPVVIVRGEASEGGEVVVGVDLSWDSELVLEHAF